jgi:hypothetical protein
MMPVEEEVDGCSSSRSRGKTVNQILLKDYLLVHPVPCSLRDHRGCSSSRSRGKTVNQILLKDYLLVHPVPCSLRDHRIGFNRGFEFLIRLLWPST